MTTVTRVKALISRFEDEKNEELFAICTSQIAKLYRQEPGPLHTLIFDTIKGLMVSKKTYKRLVAAALYEKIVEEAHEGVDQISFVFEKESLDFNPKTFVESLDKNKKEKNRSEINFEHFVNEDLFKNTQEYVKSFLVKKDNFLYSKSEKSIQAKEKAAKNGKVDEDMILTTINEELMKNEDLKFGSKKHKHDHKESIPTTKRIKEAENDEDLQTQSNIKNPTSVFDLIYQLARYLVFHPNWEMRHGALLIFRAIGRKFHKILFFDQQKGDNANESVDFSVTLDSNHRVIKIRGKELKDITLEINEDIKQKCFILLALDRFSDFLADKSNMTNRALGAEILVNLFVNVKNLDRFYFIFEFLFLQNVKNGWEPKQAFVFLAKKILEADIVSVESGSDTALIFSETILKKISDSVLKIIEEHEEITESCALFLQTLVRRPSEKLAPNYFLQCQERFLACLSRTEDISYLPKSVFEFFTVMLEAQKFDKIVLDSLEELIRKFLFHENNEVRGEIFKFISNLLTVVRTRDTGLILTDQLLKFFYLAILFYHLIHKKEIFQNKETNLDNPIELVKLNQAETEKVLAILKDIMIQLRSSELRDQLIGILFKILEEKNFDSAVQHLNVQFSYNIQKDLTVDYYGILELLIKLMQALSCAEVVRVFDSLESQFSSNSLIYIPFFFSDHCSNIPVQKAEQILETNHAIFNVPFFDANLSAAVSDLELFLVNNTSDINLEALPSLEKPVLDILMLLERKTDLKDNLVELHNLLIQMSKKLKESIERQEVPFTKLKLSIEIEGQLLPKFWKLYDFAKKFVLLLRCSAANKSLQTCLSNSTLPERNKINSLVKPFLDVFSENLPEFFAELCADALFKLVKVYQSESKHPNFKIVSNLIKKAETNATFRNNIKPYFARILEFLGPRAEEKFPEVGEIFATQDVTAALSDILLKVTSEQEGLIFADKIMDNLENGRYNGQSQKEVLFKSLFIALHGEMLNKRSNQMNRLLKHIYEMICRREEFAFMLLNILLETFRTDFINYAKIFLRENIRAINEQLEYEKSFVYEAFSKTLTLSYIDLETTDLSKLDPTLFEEFEKGRLFLYEFKNNKNFQIDLSPLFSKNLKGFSLREYQIEGIKWLFFLFKHGLSACLCDDMGLGKTIQALSSIAIVHSINSATLDNNVQIVQNENAKYPTVSLIVCPNNLIPHWKRECETYISDSLLRPTYLLANTLSEGYPMSKFLKDNPNISLVVTSYNVVAKVQDYMDVKFKAVVLDEAHLIKNPKSVTATSVKSLRSDVRLALTGTPIQNNVTELWSIFDFLMPLYLGQKDAFRKEFKSLLDMNLLSVDMKKMELSEAQAKVLEGLHKKVLPFIMRREKKDVLKELPDKIIQDFNCEMTPAQTKLYEVFENQNFGQFIEQSLSSFGEGQKNPNEPKASDQEVVKRSFFVVLSAMRKILNHPSLLPLHYIFPDIEKEKPKSKKVRKSNVQEESTQVDPIARKEEELFMIELGKKESLNPIVSQFSRSKDPDFFYTSGKFIALKELLNNLDFFEDDPMSCIDNQNKMLIFTRSNQTLALLQQFFTEKFHYIKFLALNNTQNQFQRADLVNRFNGSQEFKLLLLTPKIGGLGLNLSSANIVIMFDHDFNPMNDLQAMDRAHRLGQTKVVNVYRLVTMRTLEEKIMGIQKFKLTVANTVINVENSSINNVKESNFIGFLEDFAKGNVAKKEDRSLEEAFGSYSKYLKETDLEEIWNEDEYGKEFI